MVSTPDPSGVMNSATFGAKVITARIGYALSQPSPPRTAKYVMAAFDIAKSSSPLSSRRMFSCEPLVASAVAFQPNPAPNSFRTSARALPTTKKAPPGGAVPMLRKTRSGAASPSPPPLPPPPHDAANAHAATASPARRMSATSQAGAPVVDRPPAESGGGRFGPGAK